MLQAHKMPTAPGYADRQTLVYVLVKMANGLTIGQRPLAIHDHDHDHDHDQANQELECRLMYADGPYLGPEALVPWTKDAETVAEVFGSEHVEGGHYLAEGWRFQWNRNAVVALA